MQKAKNILTVLSLGSLTGHVLAAMLLINNSSPKKVQVDIGKKGSTESISLIPGQQSLVISQGLIRVRGLYYDMGWLTYSKSFPSCFTQGNPIKMQNMVIKEEQTANLNFLEIGTASYSATRDVHCLFTVTDDSEETVW